MNKTDVSRTDNYTIRQGNTIIPVKKAEYSSSDDQYVVELTAGDFIEEGNYELQFQNLKDTSGIYLNSQGTTIYISDIRRPQISSINVKDIKVNNVLTNKKDIEVKFDKSMQRDSIVKENFTIKKQDTGEEVLIKSVNYTSNGSNYIATITTEDFSSNGDYVIIVNNVKNYLGVKIEENTTNNFRLYNIIEPDI